VLIVDRLTTVNRKHRFCRYSVTYRRMEMMLMYLQMMKKMQEFKGESLTARYLIYIYIYS